MREPFDLAELQALPIPRATPEDIECLPAEYLAAFVAPRLSKSEDSLMCIGCGGILYLPGPMGMLFGASFTWGIVNGEGYCDRCGYPTRMYHRLPEGTGTFPLQYHPDDLVAREDL